MLTRLRAVRRGADHHNDAGFTLAEVLVGATLCGIAGALGVTMFVVVSLQATETTTRETLTSDNRGAITQIAAELRLADTPAAVPITPDGRFEVFDPDKVTFYSNRDGASRTASLSRTPPSKVSIARVADTSDPAKSKLVMTVWDPITRYGIAGKPYPNPYSYASNYPTTPTQTVVLAQGIGNDTTKPGEAVFTYCSAAPDPAPTSSSTSSTAAAACDSIVPSTSTVAATKDQENRARANQISSIIVRLRVGGEAFRSGQDGYQPATWLTTRVAVSGKVSPATVSAP